jgi:hypothetical protein
MAHKKRPAMGGGKNKAPWLSAAISGYQDPKAIINTGPESRNTESKNAGNLSNSA